MSRLVLASLLFLTRIAVVLAGAGAGAEVNDVKEINNHLLLNAINANDASQLREILRDTSISSSASSSFKRQQLNKKGNGGQTPLMFAVMSGKDKVILPLLDAGADFSIGDDSGYTPMHGAAFHGHSDIVLTLLEFGVPFLNEYHSDGRTPFHRACWGETKEHAQTVKIFLQAGVDIDQTTKTGQLCSQLTSSRHTQKVLRRLRKKQKGHLYREANANDDTLFSSVLGVGGGGGAEAVVNKKDYKEKETGSEVINNSTKNTRDTNHHGNEL